ncbi:hypothetical protein ACFQ02_05230 [Seminibacterium arietis]|uniref:Uncharacterized protein n=1 Tax=Seminibacterium arietis TaxID=1173502 RepID=A0ABW3I8P4_9PAST
MSWQQKTLKLNQKAEQALKDNLNGKPTACNLTLKGIKMGVHNWTHGIEEKSNRYLSPENAVKALKAKLTDHADPNLPQSAVQIVAIMVTSPSLDDFITACEQVQILLPEPVFKQAYDYAKASRTLQDSKMIKTPTIASPAFSKPADITPQTSRQLQGILRNAQAVATASQAADPFTALAKLKEAKKARDQQNQQQVQKLLATSVKVYTFQGDGMAASAVQIEKNIPTSQHIFTACLMFIGEDLTNIKGMLHD